MGQIQFDLDIEMKNKFYSEFRNETRKEILEPFFNEIQLYEYTNKPEIEKAIKKIIKKFSLFKIKGIYGLFQAIKPKN